MMRSFRRRNRTDRVWRGMVYCGLLIFWGCGPLPDMVSTQKEAGETYSADEVRRMTVDQPFLLSGEYFREREQKPRVVIDEMFEGEKRTASTAEASEPADQKALVKKSVPAGSSEAGADAAAEPARAASARDFALPVKIGVVIDGEGMALGVPDRIAGSVSEAVKGLPVVVADQDKVREMMARTDCSGRRDLLCLSKALGLYPGVRMLVLVESAHLPERTPGTVTARLTVVDTGLLFRYPLMEAAETAVSDSEAEAALARAIRRALAYAVDKSRMMPWFCRAFSHQDGAWFITAGGATGLEPGDLLTVLSPGTRVESPSGFPAGWLPGRPEGRIRVDRLFGYDFAACSLVEGRGPTPEDLLITAD